ncbi:hypothetical protein M405DRAFT_880062 [Rhizopogon salebrosus TDB-379]|nr:hypothetical protein M405DRAFT_880062 [Rhizopogon salebrosus TDB-379]
MVTDELNGELAPISSRLKAIEKERAERWKAHKQTRVAHEASSSSAQPEQGTSNTEAILGVEMAPAGGEVPGDLEEENIYCARELSDLEGLVSADWTSEYGCSVTGLYDLVVIMTHKGSVFYGNSGEANAKDDENWYKFDDETSVPEGEVGDDS